MENFCMQYQICLFVCLLQERRRLAIQNAAQQWEELKSSSELPTQNDVKDDVSPDSSPAHSPALTNGNAQETSPDEPR